MTTLLFLFCFLLCPQVFAANTLTLYDDFNNNALDPEKWLVEPTENAGAITEDNGTLKISGEFEMGQDLKCFLLGPNKTFDAIEAKIKLSGTTALVKGFGLSLYLWNDGIFDYYANISFEKMLYEDPLLIKGYIKKILGENNINNVPIPKDNPPLEQLLSPGTLCSNASFDTWYLVRIAREGAQACFYLREGNGELREEDVKAVYTAEGIVGPPVAAKLYLTSGAAPVYPPSGVEGYFDDISVGHQLFSYSISGSVAGAPDNATVGLYAGTFPLETRKLQADGTYTFRFLNDQKTYTVRSPYPCCTLVPDAKTVTIEGADQKDVDFTVAPDNASAEARYAIQGGRLIDGNGGEPVDDALILVKGNRIQSISKASETRIPEGYRVIDAHGKTIIPGLFDMHTHVWREATPKFAPYVLDELISVEYQKNLYAFLYCGVTSVLDLIGVEGFMFDLRNKEQQGCLLAPRIHTAGWAIKEYQSLGKQLGPLRYAETPEDARKAVELYAQKKPDVAKIVYEGAFDMPTLKALIDESRSQGLRSVVHAPMNWDSKKVASLAPDALAHTPIFPDEEVINTIIKNKVAVISTLSLTRSNSALSDNPDLIDDPFIKSCVDPRLRSAYKDPAFVRAANNSFNPGYWVQVLWEASTPDLYQKLRTMHDAGILLMMGTDVGTNCNFQGPAEHAEMSYLVDAGFTPLQAITMATKNGPLFLGKLDQQGTIEAGKLADLVILKADPSTDISNTRKIALVMKDGKIMDRGMLSRDITGRLSEEARYIADRIDLMPVSAFKSSDAGGKATLAGELEEIYSLLKQADDNETGQQGYAQASRMLSDAVMPLFDGCENGSVSNDLITDCAYQKEIYAAAQQLVEDCSKKGIVLQ